MKVTPVVVAVLITGSFIGVGCAPTTVPTNGTNEAAQTGANSYVAIASDSDFTPPLNRAVNPAENSAGERRLLLARSEDGVTFTANGTILTDQGNVPDMVVTPDGTIYLYYVGQGVDSGKESTPVALSQDNGTTWSFRRTAVNNSPQPMTPSDPDVVLREDGTFRMYYTSSIGFTDKIGIVYADSTDGINFTYGGEALVRPDGSVIDSTTFYFNNQWHMFVLNHFQPNQLHATSTDGITFTLVSDEPISLPVEHYILSNPIVSETTVRMFAFQVRDKNIRSFTSTDLDTWTADDIVLAPDDVSTLGSDYLQDSTVGQLSDGSYLMVYVSELP